MKGNKRGKGTFRHHIISALRHFGTKIFRTKAFLCTSHSKTGQGITMAETLTSWLLKEAKFVRLPLLETTTSSLSSARCAPYLEPLDSFNGVTETYHLSSLTVSPGVTEPYHPSYWTISPGFNGPYHLTLLDSFTWRY